MKKGSSVYVQYEVHEKWVCLVRFLTSKCTKEWCGYTHGVYVLYEVHERWVCLVGFEYLPLVEEGVDQVRVGVETVTECGVEDFQNHQQNLLKNSTVCRL